MSDNPQQRSFAQHLSALRKHFKPGNRAIRRVREARERHLISKFRSLRPTKKQSSDTDSLTSAKPEHSSLSSDQSTIASDQDQSSLGQDQPGVGSDQPQPSHQSAANHQSERKPSSVLRPDPSIVGKGIYRRWRTRDIGIQLLSAAVIAATGIFVGLSIRSATDNTTVSQPTIVPVTTVDSDPVEETVDVLPTVPLTDEGVEAVEPVQAVARAVIPSVVLIRAGSDFGTGGTQGSGIVWDAENGYIVTNQHVIQEGNQPSPDTVSVTFVDGTEVTGEVIGGSTNQDIAVIRVDPEAVDLVAAEFAPTSSVQIGQLAVAVGSPFGLASTVTAGIVSSVRVIAHDPFDGSPVVPVEMIQTDAPINPGNSGGALADRFGRVIGINQLIQTSGGVAGNVGIGFAIPSDTVDLIANRIVRGDSLELGFLGISSEPGVNQDGIPVSEVVDGSAAEDAGLRVGDVIVAFEGKPVSKIDELAAAVKLHLPGEEVKVTIRRDGDLFDAFVTLGSDPNR